MTIRPRADSADLYALDQKYSRDDFAEGWTSDGSLATSDVLIVLTIERWIAWADRDS